MKIGYIGSRASAMIIEHVKNVEIGISTGCEAVIVEDVLQSVPEDLLAINTSNAVKTFQLRQDLQKEFYEEFGIIKKTPQNFLYTFFNGHKFGDFIEVDYSMRFMSCNAGPALGFIQGAAVACDASVYDAFPSLRKLEKALEEMEYHGEITFGITKDFSLCDIRFGHFTGGFALYAELAENSVQSLYKYCAGEAATCTVHKDSVAICTLLSLSPFPVELKVNTRIVTSPAAEKHLYKYWYTSEQQVAYVACWGITLNEARQRAYRVINTCRQHNSDLQYRADIGRRVSFIFNHEAAAKLQRYPLKSDESQEKGQAEELA